MGYPSREVLAAWIDGLAPGERVTGRGPDVYKRQLLARTRRLVESATKSLDEFAISDACDAVTDYIDLLTNWYIRNRCV